MKKFIAAILVLTMVFAFASVAMAGSTSFDIVTTSTSEFKVGTALVTKEINTKDWNISINASTSNVTPTHRAVTRVHRQTEAISATWVYSQPNSTAHPYNAAQLNSKVDQVTFRGRLDDRDSGTLEFHGTFRY